MYKDVYHTQTKEFIFFLTVFFFGVVFCYHESNFHFEFSTGANIRYNNKIIKSQKGNKNFRKYFTTFCACMDQLAHT